MGFVNGMVVHNADEGRKREKSPRKGVHKVDEGRKMSEKSVGRSFIKRMRDRNE